MVLVVFCTSVDMIQLNAAAYPGDQEDSLSSSTGASFTALGSF